MIYSVLRSADALLIAAWGIIKYKAGRMNERWRNQKTLRKEMFGNTKNMVLLSQIWVWYFLNGLTFLNKQYDSVWKSHSSNSNDLFLKERNVETLPNFKLNYEGMIKTHQRDKSPEKLYHLG